MGFIKIKNKKCSISTFLSTIKNNLKSNLKIIDILIKIPHNH